MKKMLEKSYQNSELILYQTEDGKTRLEVRFEGDTAWLSQSQMAELFQTTKQNISLHIKNIFGEGELVANSSVKDYLTTAADGKEYSTYYYNLDVSISAPFICRGSIYCTNLQLHLRQLSMAQ